MKVTEILFGQVIRTVKISGPSGRKIYGAHLAKACEDRYGFLQGPRTVPEFDTTKGVTFLHGIFEETVIDRFVVFNNGIIAEAKARTDLCERFLVDVMKWVTDLAGVVFDETESKNFYMSQIEVELDASLIDAFPKYRDFGQRISNVIRSYGHIVPDLRVSGLLLSTDAASTFKLERREGAGIESAKYFCSAPVRTDDHIGLVEAAEALFKEA